MASLDTLAKLQDVHAYTIEGAQRKAKTHTSGRAFLRQLVADLGLPPAEYSIRSNKGGMAVSGEVTLHTDRIYVQIMESCIGARGLHALYRSCKSQRDYSGGTNNWRAMSAIRADYPAFVAQCKALMANPR